MIASNAAVIGQEMFGLTATTAAFYVSLYSLSNCLGRVIWRFLIRLGAQYSVIIYGVVALSFTRFDTFKCSDDLCSGNHWD